MPTLNQTIKKVKEFAKLPDGWHFGSGVPASVERVNQAIAALCLADFSGITVMNAFPGVEGEILVSFYNEEYTLDITLEIDDSFTVAQDESDSQVGFTEGNSKEQAFDKIREFGQRICDSSEQYIGHTTIPCGEDSKALRSALQATAGFQSLIPRVLAPSVTPPANIWFDSIQGKWVIRLSTGQYRMKQSRRNASLSQLRAIPEMYVMPTYSGGLKARRGKSSRA